MAPKATSKASGNTPSQMAAAQRTMFSLTGGGYDPDKTYCHSTDGKGHYEQVRVKITPTMEATVAEMVAGKQFDYRTSEDFIRDAMVHRLHFLGQSAPTMQNVVTAEIMQADLARRRVEIEAWSENIKILRETGEVYLANGALEELGNMLSEADHNYDFMNLPIVKRHEMREVLDNLYDRLKRARRRDYQLD